MGARRRLGRGQAPREALHHRRGSRQGGAEQSRLPHAHDRALRGREFAGAEAVERHQGHPRSPRRHHRSRPERQPHRRDEGAGDVAHRARRRRPRREHDARRRPAHHRRLQPRGNDRSEGPQRQPGQVRPVQAAARRGEAERARRRAVAWGQHGGDGATGDGVDHGGAAAARDARRWAAGVGRGQALYRRQRRRADRVDVRRLEQGSHRHRPRQQGLPGQRRGLSGDLQAAGQPADGSRDSRRHARRRRPRDRLGRRHLRRGAEGPPGQGAAPLDHPRQSPDRGRDPQDGRDAEGVRLRVPGSAGAVPVVDRRHLRRQFRARAQPAARAVQLLRQGRRHLGRGVGLQCHPVPGAVRVVGVDRPRAAGGHLRQGALRHGRVDRHPHGAQVVHDLGRAPAVPGRPRRLAGGRQGRRHRRLGPQSLHRRPSGLEGSRAAR